MRSKAIVITVGAVALTVAATLGLFWKPLLTEYHLHRLRSQDEHFREVAAEREGSAAHAAVEKFVMTDEGARRVFDACLYFCNRYLGIPDILGANKVAATYFFETKSFLLVADSNFSASMASMFRGTPDDELRAALSRWAPLVKEQ